MPMTTRRYGSDFFIILSSREEMQARMAGEEKSDDCRTGITDSQSLSRRRERDVGQDPTG